MIEFAISQYEDNPALFDHPVGKCINWGHHLVEIGKYISSYVEEEGFSVAHAKNVGVIENLFVTNINKDVDVHVNAELLEAENFKMLNIGLPGMNHMKGKRPTYIKFRSLNPYTRVSGIWEFHGMMAALVWDAFDLNEGVTGANS